MSQRAERTPAPLQTPSHVGIWNARLPNEAGARLILQADGRFHWSATNKSGRTRTFQGSYTAGSGSLTIVRSGDNQKLSGTTTPAGDNAFNFKLAGANDAGLNFVRG